MRSIPVLGAGLAALAMLSGCGNLSGLDADSKFACKAPDGVTCMSVSGIYANSKANNLPGQRVRHDPAAPAAATPANPLPTRPGIDYDAPDPLASSTGPAAKASPKGMSAPSSGAPLRTPERVLRVWMAPFVDQDGSFHDQSYFYFTASPGQWAIEANLVNVQSRFRQVHPLSRDNPANKQRQAQEAQSNASSASQTLPVAPAPQTAGDAQQP